MGTDHPLWAAGTNKAFNCKLLLSFG